MNKLASRVQDDRPDPMAGSGRCFLFLFVPSPRQRKEIQRDPFEFGHFPIPTGKVKPNETDEKFMVGFGGFFFFVRSVLPRGKENNSRSTLFFPSFILYRNRTGRPTLRLVLRSLLVVDLVRLSEDYSMGRDGTQQHPHSTHTNTKQRTYHSPCTGDCRSSRSI